ncbi:MAG: hypothetical protein M3245_05595 [Actinomycetota bacterium]|nr:hypothetical protein [Actinomycetota bacterium]
MAVSIRTEPRFTRDIDLAVAVGGDEEAEALVAALSERGWSITSTLEHDAVRRLAAVRLEPSAKAREGRVVDLLFASSGIEPELVGAAEELEVLPGLRTRVARTGHLIVLKALARTDDRPQDAADLDALLKRADPADLLLARKGARLVVERGFHRGRALIQELELLLSGGPGP